MKTILEYESGKQRLRVTLQGDKFGWVLEKLWEGDIHFANELRKELEKSTGDINEIEVLGRGFALDHGANLTVSYIDWPSLPLDDGDDFGERD